MTPRVTSELWVHALLRRARAGGAFATVLRRGADGAGAIFVVVNRGGRDGPFDLHAPAPQSFALDDDGHSDRRFECVLEAVDQTSVDERLARETRFDPDLWTIEIEDREARPFLS